MYVYIMAILCYLNYMIWVKNPSSLFNAERFKNAWRVKHWGVRNEIEMTKDLISRTLKRWCAVEKRQEYFSWFQLVETIAEDVLSGAGSGRLKSTARKGNSQW